MSFYDNLYRQSAALAQTFFYTASVQERNVSLNSNNDIGSLDLLPSSINVKHTNITSTKDDSRIQRV